MCPAGIVHAIFEVIWEDDIKPLLFFWRKKNALRSK